MSISYQPTPDCPGAAVLARYHEGKLAGEQARVLQDHVKTCAHCQRRMARLDLLARTSDKEVLAAAAAAERDPDDDEETAAGQPSGGSSGAFTMVDDPRARPTDENMPAVKEPPVTAPLTVPAKEKDKRASREIRPPLRESGLVTLREKERESRITELTGWRCIRITWADLDRPNATVTRILSLLGVASRAPSFTS